MGVKKINFVKDVASVLGCDCAEIRRQYPHLETAKCRDVISASTLGELRCDGLALASLKMRRNFAPVGLQEFVIDEKNSHVPKIILILESPHKDEYRVRCYECSKQNQCGLYSTPVPARGMTGISIKMKLPLLFNQRFDDYYVGFMNLIQYQCSLGVDISVDNKSKISIKDKIVWSLFDDDKFSYKDDFISRLENAYNSEYDIIVVCSTGGRDKRNHICKIIETSLRDVRCLLSTGHPISWLQKQRNSNFEIKACRNMAEIASNNSTIEDHSQLFAILSGEKCSRKGYIEFQSYERKPENGK